MAATSAPTRTALPIVVPGQLTLRTIRGKNGPFTVGRLTTPIGEFAVKDAELEQYPEGKYDGEFIIRYIFAKSYPVAGGARGPPQLGFTPAGRFERSFLRERRAAPTMAAPTS